MSNLTYIGFGAGPWTHNDGTVDYTTAAPVTAGNPSTYIGLGGLLGRYWNGSYAVTPPAPVVYSGTTYLGFGAGPWRHWDGSYAVPVSAATKSVTFSVVLNVGIDPFDQVQFDVQFAAPLTTAVGPSIVGDPVDPPMFNGTIPNQAFARGVPVDGDFSTYFDSEVGGSYSLQGWPAGVSINASGVISGTPSVGGLFTGATVTFTNIAGQPAVSNVFQVVVAVAPMRQTRPWRVAPTITKDAQEVRAVECPWGDLDEDDIESSDWSASELQPDYGYVLGSVAVGMFSGGVSGQTYRLVNRITTGRGETRERFAYLCVTDQESGDFYG